MPVAGHPDPARDPGDGQLIYRIRAPQASPSNGALIADASGFLRAALAAGFLGKFTPQSRFGSKR